MDINTAYSLVVEDVRASYPEMTHAEAVDHTWNTITLKPAEQAPAGATSLGPDDGTELWDAYKMVLEDETSVHEWMGWMASQTPAAEASER